MAVVGGLAREMLIHRILHRRHDPFPELSWTDGLSFAALPEHLDDFCKGDSQGLLGRATGLGIFILREQGIVESRREEPPEPRNLTEHLNGGIGVAGESHIDESTEAWARLLWLLVRRVVHTEEGGYRGL